jgi:hypothetical protein
MMIFGLEQNATIGIWHVLNEDERETIVSVGYCGHMFKAEKRTRDHPGDSLCLGCIGSERGRNEKLSVTQKGNRNAANSCE